MHIMYSQLSQEVRIVINNKQEEPIAYQIANADGRIVRKGVLPDNSKVHNISTNGMPEGDYVFSTALTSIRFEKKKLFR